jgi:signal transduction histidine kinase
VSHVPDPPAGSAQAEGAWLRQLAHDLRNQLAPMRTATQMLQLGKLEPERQREMLDMLERQILRLVRMLDDLDEYGKVRAGAPGAARERIDLAMLVDTALGECGRHLAAAGQQLDQRMPEQRVPVEVERQRMVRLITRLLDNAHRFTPQGGTITLEVRPLDGHAEVHVRDNGAGIDADRMSTIFDLPLRGRTVSKLGGLGISLALARACAEAHGGSLEAHSDGPDKGSEFVLRIPLAG